MNVIALLDIDEFVSKKVEESMATFFDQVVARLQGIEAKIDLEKQQGVIVLQALEELKAKVAEVVTDDQRSQIESMFDDVSEAITHILPDESTNPEPPVEQPAEPPVEQPTEPTVNPDEPPPAPELPTEGV